METAWAKLNLSLKIIGKRDDGYHELESLVVFASIGDELCVEQGSHFSLTVDGPEAGQIAGENLLERVGQSLISEYGCKGLGRVHLTKKLPVAAGLGGGSADVGALIRQVQQMGLARFDGDDIAGFGQKFGADVPVCVASSPALMRGIGEKLELLGQFPKMGVLLVNPRVAVSTRQVFQCLDAPLIGEGAVADAAGGSDENAVCPCIEFSSAGDVISYMKAAPNDLTCAAVEVAPVIGRVLSEIEKLEGCLIARLSGSGATCFGLFESETAARIAAEQFRVGHDAWWIECSFIGP